MHKEFLMGNEAIALGALAAGVRLVAGYPGTPSTEVLETVAKHRLPETYVEWSGQSTKRLPWKWGQVLPMAEPGCWLP